ncbi:MerR family transcriptional regulator [Actinopolymorpha pittospori]|uniref:DNA-binding transcriptional MerR regulator n=1 Tax=Actinopolymorpha pittospori TaxID=648752 RepID=A0A927MVN4_9ACTN|nr:MerR family DNA-binding transcriptional regulator [Actinopolymorpha pittospori]MBE1607745.1 DNA-binding transcriptional MerR regulator [Actinopolymorpha pittospori]
MPEAVPRTWTITQLAEEYAVTLRTIRFYEDKGLLRPERRGNQRVFGARDHVRLGLVLRGRRLGFSLGEIATIIDMYDAEPGEVGQLRYLLDQIVVRRTDLEQRRDDIDTTLRELDEVEARCREDLKRLGERVSGAVGEERAARTAKEKPNATRRTQRLGRRDG